MNCTGVDLYVTNVINIKTKVEKALMNANDYMQENNEPSEEILRTDHIDYLLNRSQKIEEINKLLQQREEFQEKTDSEKDSNDVNSSDRRTGVIQKLYDKCIQKWNDRTFVELYNVLDPYCQSAVKKTLDVHGCFSIENYEDCLQIARMKTWLKVDEHMRQGEYIKYFASYCYSIYIFSTTNAIKSFGYKVRANDSSLDEPVSTESDEPLVNSVPDDDAWEKREEEEKRKLFWELIELSCSWLMTSDHEPQKLISFCYAKLLFNILSRLESGNSGSPKGFVAEPKVMSSIKWAYDKMSGRSVNDLADEIEDVMKKHISTSLHWGNSFTEKLEKTVDVSVEQTLGHLILTDKYDKESLSNMVESMTDALIKSVSKLIRKDLRLLGMIGHHVAANSGLYKKLTR